MNIHYAIASILTTFICLIVGSLVFFKNRQSFINKSYFLLTLSTAVWAVGIYFHAVINNIYWCLFWGRFSHIGASFIPVCFLQFILVFCDLYEKKKFIIKIGYFLATLFSIIAFHPSFFTSVSPKITLKLWADAGPIYPFFIIFFTGYLFYAFYVALITYINLSSYRKNQLKYIILASILGFSGGSSTFLAVYGIRVNLLYPYGVYLVSFYNIVITYAIVRYRLMDIKLAVTRFGIFTFVYALVLGIPFGIGFWGRPYLERLGYHWWLIPTGLCLFLATLGPFIYLRLEKRSRELIYKTDFKRYETLRRFSKTLLLIKELDKLVELIVYRLVKTLKVTYAGIYLYDKEKDAYVLKSFRPLKYLNAPKEETISKVNPLIKLLFTWKRELIREEIKNLPLHKKEENNNHLDLNAAEARMRDILATLIIPHFLENELLGFLVLGDKEKGAVYTEEDISILSALSNSAALAIENALFLTDLKITQAELFNAKRIAELGYMASAMGHEINNRLQAIYTTALDLVDNDLISNCFKDNPQAKAAFDKDIDYINESVEDASKIINELKTYARPQDKAKQTFQPIDLSEAIDKALNIVRLQSIKRFDAIDLDIHIPKNLPKTPGNFIQLQQVFVNMLNNAHDAIVEKKDYIFHNPELNLGDYKGKIQIAIKRVKNTLEIHIIDDGIGMTEDVKKRIFIPLYTSKASSERKSEREIKGGTGIGLYTIQTIIRGHDGFISVHSTERLEGADFLITLPVAKEALS